MGTHTARLALLALVTSLVAFAEEQSITPSERVAWFTTSTVGPTSLAGGVISAGWGTAFNQPKEYGTHWEGFGKRYGMRLTGVATGNLIEAGVGALWGEDPRYARVPERSFGGRLGNVVKMTFMAKDADGRLRPAYARFIANAGNNYLSNTWRADSEATTSRATLRIGFGFLARMSGNAFNEFFPDARDRLFHRHK